MNGRSKRSRLGCRYLWFPGLTYRIRGYRLVTMMMKLWVDDERPTPDGFIRSTSSNDAILRLAASANACIFWDEVSLDHDLGGDDTGMKVLDWMVEHNVWPKVLTIHTSNPPARKRMLATAHHEGPMDMDIYVIADHLKRV